MDYKEVLDATGPASEERMFLERMGHYSWKDKNMAAQSENDSDD